MTEPAPEPPIISLSFRCVSGCPAYLEGAPAGSLYMSKRGMMDRVAALIEDGKLTAGAQARPALLEVRGGGGFYVALLDDGAPPRAPPEDTPRMQPLTAFDEERRMLRLMEEGRSREFAALAGVPGRAAGRTVVMLDRGRAMAGPWALWDELPKHRAAGFLADAYAHLCRNPTLLSYASRPRWERGAAHVAPDASEAALEPALTEACLVDPGTLLLVTDGGVRRPTPTRLLADLAESGVRIRVIVVAGRDEPAGPGWAPTPGFKLRELRTGGDLAGLAHGRLLA
jgi:hypothetical protein